MDEALCALRSDVSHLTDPVGWLKAEGEYVTGILHDVASVVEDDAIVDLLSDAANIAFPVGNLHANKRSQQVSDLLSETHAIYAYTSHVL